MPDQTWVALWKAMKEPELQYCELSETNVGWRLAGTVVTVANNEPALISYQVDVDRAWATRRVAVDAALGIQPPVRLRLTVDAGGHWRAERSPEPAAPWIELSDLTGLRDIDLAFTPATNTLPVRRLQPAVGETISVTAAWLRFPELVIEPLPQTYQRLDRHRFHYESHGGAFTAGITFDAHDLVVDLVVDYEGLWSRLVTASSAHR